MNRYVLEILDGDQAGAVVELGEDRLLVGRKPDCNFVLRDEKCSGHHAEIVFEDGRHVLRDLGSTNGTTMDGRRVQEVVLSPRDEFVIGRVHAIYREAADSGGAAGDGGQGDLDDVQVGRIDAARLARTGRRRGSLVLTLMFVGIVAAGGLFAWRTFVADDSGPGPRQLRPMEIRGNRLTAAAADFETEASFAEEGGWKLDVLDSGVPFDIASGRARAHSGTAALVAVGMTAEEDGGEPRVLALARLFEPIRVGVGEAIRVVAHVRTHGRGRALVRAVFGAGEEDVSIRTGTGPIESVDEFVEVGFALRAPRGADRVTLELIAFVPGPEDEVLIDDVGVVFEGDVPALAGSAGGTVLLGAGAGVRVVGATLPTLLGVLPLVGNDPLLGALARNNVLCASDAGVELAVAPLEGDVGYRLSWTGAPVLGMALRFPPESANCRTRGEDGSFEPRDPEFEADGVAEILCGTGENRASIVLPEPRTARGMLRPSAWRLEVVGVTSFDLRVVFSEEAVRAREVLRTARFAAEEDRLGAALTATDELIRSLPHDIRALRGAQELRAELLARQEREVESLLREGNEAEFFDARVGYQRVTGAVDQLLERYGADHVVRADELGALRERMTGGIETLDVREGRERAELLGLLAGAFEQVGNVELAKFVRSYVDRRLPKGGN